MADLTAVSPSAAGTAYTLVAAAGGGDRWANTGADFVHIKNAGGAPITVTFDSPGTCNFGAAANAAHDLQVTVSNGTEKIVGPFDKGKFNDANGWCNISYSDVTSVTVRVVRS